MEARAAAGNWVICARVLVPLPLDVLAAFLCDLANQALLFDSVGEVSGEATTASLVLRLPARSWQVQASAVADGGVIAVELTRASRSRARLRWRLEALRAVTGVELSLELIRPRRLARTVLRAGGRRWLARELERALDALAEVALLAGAAGTKEDPGDQDLVSA